MTSLLRGLWNLLRAQHDNAAKAIADPIRDAEFDIADAKKQVQVFEQKIAQLMATNITTNKKAQAKVNEAAKWDQIAANAAKSNDRETVVKAITQKNNCQKQHEVFDAEYQKNEKVIQQLRSQLTANRAKIASAESNKAQLAARLEGAKIRQELMGASNLVDGGPLSRLDKLQEAVDASESQAEAYEALSDQDLDQLAMKYETSESDVSDEVDRLMATAK